MAKESVTQKDLWRVLDLLDGLKMRYWVDGGWGVDILCGRQNREHRDVDIDFDAAFTAVLLEELSRAGYTVATDWRPCRIELEHPQLGFLDIHPLEIAADGSARQAAPDGGGWYEFAADYFTEATFRGRVIPCISAKAQKLFHTGYELREKDETDMRNLEAVYGGVPNGHELHMSGFDPLEIIRSFYPEDSPLRRLLLKHSMQVRDRALAIAGSPACVDMGIDVRLAADGALLHDIGIMACRAPGIFCMGSEPYIAHGVIGARMLREYGAAHGLNLEPYARICERHTGSGIAASEVRRQSLPIPEKDYLPETVEEKLVCLADKFYSKSGDMKEKTLEHVRRSMVKFGSGSVERFDEMCRLFGVN